MIFILLISLFISLSLYIETFGSYFRAIGSFDSTPALGYSSHVRLATISRFFVLVSAPFLGYLVDSGLNSSDIALVGVFSFLFYIVFNCIFWLFFSNLFIYKIYCLLNFIKHHKDLCTPPISFSFSTSSRKLFIFSIFAFSLTSIGVLIVNYIAAGFPEYRAMIVQSSAVVTTLGTLAHVFLIDPVLSRKSDIGFVSSLKSINDLILGRFIASLILMFCFLALYFL